MGRKLEWRCVGENRPFGRWDIDLIEVGLAIRRRVDAYTPHRGVRKYRSRPHGYSWRTARRVHSGNPAFSWASRIFNRSSGERRPLFSRIVETLQWGIMRRQSAITR
jgi:hypothetical protein